MIFRRPAVKTIILLLITLLFLQGKEALAAIPESYNIDLQYDAGKTVIPAALAATEKLRRLTIVVAEFTDVRPGQDKQKIGHVREIGDALVPVFSRKGPITRVVADGVKRYLKKAGYKTTDGMAPWDLQEKTAPRGVGRVIIGGSIDDWEASCWTGVFTNDYKIRMKITLVIADGISGKILYRENVTVTRSRTDVSFSEEQLGNEASQALGEAIKKIFEGKAIAQQMKRALFK